MTCGGDPDDEKGGDAADGGKTAPAPLPAGRCNASSVPDSNLLDEVPRTASTSKGLGKGRKACAHCSVVIPASTKVCPMCNKRCALPEKRGRDVAAAGKRGNENRSKQLKVYARRRQDAGSDATSVNSCLVCFEKIAPGTAVALDPCGHMFHEKCIGAWLEKQNTCPLCRTRIKFHDGKALEDRNVQGLDMYYETVQCCYCGLDDDDDKMLLCDGCDAGFHIYCLNPPLERVPECDWFCDACRREQEGMGQQSDPGRAKTRDAPQAAPSNLRGCVGRTNGLLRVEDRPRVPRLCAGSRRKEKIDANGETRCAACDTEDAEKYHFSKKHGQLLCHKCYMRQWYRDKKANNNRNAA